MWRLPSRMTGPAPVSISFPLDDGKHHSKQLPSLPRPHHPTDDDDVISVAAQSPRFPRNPEKKARSHGNGKVPSQISAVETDNHDSPHCEVYKTHSVGSPEKELPSSLSDGQYRHHHHHHHNHNRDERTSEPRRTSGWLQYNPTYDDDRPGDENRHKSSYVWRVLVRSLISISVRATARHLLIHLVIGLPYLPQSLPQHLECSLHLLNPPHRHHQLPMQKPSFLELHYLRRDYNLILVTPASTTLTFPISVSTSSSFFSRFRRTAVGSRTLILTHFRGPNQRNFGLCVFCVVIYRSFAG